MKTAVDLLKVKLISIFVNDKGFNKLFEQAKEMEKQQMCDFFREGYMWCNSPSLHIKNGEVITSTVRYGELYYERKYGSKGSDDHIVDINKMVSSQTEISDEEIEKAAAHHEPMVTRRAWVSACKWYREQLKQRQ